MSKLIKDAVLTLEGDIFDDFGFNVDLLENKARGFMFIVDAGVAAVSGTLGAYIQRLCEQEGIDVTWYTADKRRYVFKLLRGKRTKREAENGYDDEVAAKVVAMLRDIGEEVTVRGVADELGMSHGVMNKQLRSMASNGVIGCISRKNGGKGRPTNFYFIDEQ